MRSKTKLYVDWLIYILATIILSFVWTYSIFYIGTMTSEAKTPIKLSFLLVYSLCRTYITPILLIFAIMARLFDDRIRNTPIFIKS